MANSEPILDWFVRHQEQSDGFKLDTLDQDIPTTGEISRGAHWLVHNGLSILKDGETIGMLAQRIVAERPDGKFFRIIHAYVSGARREIGRWNQLLLEELDAKEFAGQRVSGLISLVRREVDGSVEFLVQAKAEPGNTEVPGNILLAPTIQASFSNVRQSGNKIPLWGQLGIDLEALEGGLQNPDTKWRIQPKDGGRFVASNNLMLSRLVPAELGAQLEVNSPVHRWTNGDEIRQLQERGWVNSHLNEALGMYRFD